MTDKNCQVYSPASMHELELLYYTRTGEVDICDAKINGQSISDQLYQLIIERDRAVFETAILFHIKKNEDSQGRIPRTGERRETIELYDNGFNTQTKEHP